MSLCYICISSLFGSITRERRVVNLSLRYTVIGVECSKYVVGYDLASHANY